MGGEHWVELFRSRLLGDRREELNLSQKQVARRARIAQSTYSDYERGEQKPTVHNLSMLAKALRCKSTDLLEPGDPTVERLRLDKGLTKEEVADRAGINRNDYSKIEAGTEAVDGDQLRRLTRVLGRKLPPLVKRKD